MLKTVKDEISLSLTVAERSELGPCMEGVSFFVWTSLSYKKWPASIWTKK